MASIRRKLASPFWFACYTLPDGGRTQRSTKLTDRKKALAMAMKWEEASAGRITEAQARRVLSDIHEQVHGHPLNSPSTSDYMAQWLGRKTGETAEVTLQAYKHVAHDFGAFLQERVSEPIHYITAAQIAAWRDATAKRASPRTANNKLKIIRTMFQAAWRDGIIADNPAAKVSVLKAAEATRRPFTIRELRAILEVASGEWKGMILAGLYTGQRLKDIASLTWANVDLERGEIRLSTSKTGRRQIIPMAKPLRTFISDRAAGDNPKAPLFPNAFTYGTRSGGSSVLSQQFYEILVAAGLAPVRTIIRDHTGVGRSAKRAKSDISFHSLRHTATSLLKGAGVSESVAREIIGHESAEISRHYTHVDEDQKRQALERLPDITA